MAHTLLLEIGTEEIPAGYLPPAAAWLNDTLTAGLAERRLHCDRIETLAAPRRLIVQVFGLADRQDDLDKDVMGPPVKAAFAPDGSLTRAGEGFARGQGVEPSALRRVDTPKGEYVAATVHVAGRPTTEVLLEWLPSVVTGVPFPRTMKWQGEGLRFARPIRWLVSLLDHDLLPIVVGDLTAGRLSRGHRLFTTAPVEVDHAAHLVPLLEKAGVLADSSVRAARISEEIARSAASVGGQVVADDDLLEEVSYLVEYPTAIVGSFDPEYLALPREVIVTAMKSHQRYFSVEDAAGRLKPNFIAVANGRWTDTSQVVAGNERVLRARLADARFYWDTDLKVGLVNKVDDLKNVVWLEGAGTLFDRTERVMRLVQWLGTALKTSGGAAVADVAALQAAARAAYLAKADLATEMIKDGKEFTSLQGIMGGEYARAGGEPAEVIMGIREHYAPRGPADQLPTTVPGLLVSLADRFDVIAGCFAMGLIPSGSQDPYALRRAANGIMRILLEKGWHLELDQAVAFAVAGLPAGARDRADGGADAVSAQVRDFLSDRLDYFLRDAGLPYDVTAATLAADAHDPVDARARANALAAIRGEADLEKLVIGFKRAANILKGVSESLPAVDAALLSGALPVEQALHTAAAAARRAIDDAVARVDYPTAVAAFLTLRAPIDAFFDGVMVMSDDADERRRRLGLLAEVKGLFDRLYDLARIVVEG